MYEPKYPCDVPNASGEFSCPFGAEFDSSGFACRNHCGLGVDESYIPEDEDEITAEDLAEYQGRYKYFLMYKDFQNGAISGEEWQKFCEEKLDEILEENSEVLERMKEN